MDKNGIRLSYAIENDMKPKNYELLILEIFNLVFSDYGLLHSINLKLKLWMKPTVLTNEPLRRDYCILCPTPVHIPCPISFSVIWLLTTKALLVDEVDIGLFLSHLYNHNLKFFFLFATPGFSHIWTDETISKIILIRFFYDSWASEIV